MKKEIKLGCPMEYEVDNIIHNGLFLRENEVNIVFKELEKLNKQKEEIDKVINYIENIKKEYVLRYSDGIKFEDLEEINNILELLEEIK